MRAQTEKVSANHQAISVQGGDLKRWLCCSIRAPCCLRFRWCWLAGISLCACVVVATAMTITEYCCPVPLAEMAGRGANCGKVHSCYAEVLYGPFPRRSSRELADGRLVFQLCAYCVAWGLSGSSASFIQWMCVCAVSCPILCGGALLAILLGFSQMPVLLLVGVST